MFFGFFFGQSDGAQSPKPSYFTVRQLPQLRSGRYCVLPSPIDAPFLLLFFFPFLHHSCRCHIPLVCFFSLSFSLQNRQILLSFFFGYTRKSDLICSNAFAVSIFTLVRALSFVCRFSAPLGFLSFLFLSSCALIFLAVFFGTPFGGP